MRCLKKDNRYLFESYLLSNAFFADIIQREGHERLYKVTSIISSLLMSDNNVDAIIYESVKVKNSPNIAIKPKVVDNYLVHSEVFSIKINEDLGYGLYYVKSIKKGEICNNKILTWYNN